MTETEALERRIDELCAENERLRNQLHDQQDTSEHNFVRNAREYKRVCDENAKLVVKLNTEHIVRQNVEIENTKLREQLAKARDPQRIGGTADPESFVYAIEQLREFRWQHATNDEEAIPYINNVADAHERENAKLREFIAEAHENNLLHNNAWCYFLCKHFEGVYWPEGDPCECERCYFADKFNELGIEVPE